jgi:hypothetical protein
VKLPTIAWLVEATSLNNADSTLKFSQKVAIFNNCRCHN